MFFLLWTPSQLLKIFAQPTKEPYVRMVPRKGHSNGLAGLDEKQEVADTLTDMEQVWPLVVVKGGEQSIFIKVGNTSSGNNPRAQLRNVSNRINPNLPFKVIAEFEEGEWPLPEGYCRLGEYLNLVATDIIHAWRWEELEIRLPRTEIPLNTSPIEIQGLENLKRLTWSGPPQQMRFESWLPLTPSIIQSLTTLNLSCEITASQFSKTLSYGKRLEEFTFQTVADCEEPEADILNPLIQATILPCLKSLAITSRVDIQLCLKGFQFPSLRSANFDFSYLRPSDQFPSFGGIPWKELETLTIRADLTREAFMAIKSICGPETQRKFTQASRIVF
ncbi:hypothetical protein DXG01_002570 [Tephrocybe rancida]|nr:hypothetical protein DXG01_002570 [Tephrocybe rancida]